MTASTWCRQLRPLQLEELDDFLTQSGSWSHGLPPAGMSIDYGNVSPAVSLPRICGYPSGPFEPGTRHWASLGELTFGDEAQAVQLVARWLTAFDPVVVAAMAAEDLPIIYDQEAVMRWIRSTFRGELAGGVEQFQFKMDWGNPGNDPVLGESEAGAFAQFLADQFAAVFIAAQPSGNSLQQLLNTSVKFTEVGVASWLQDVAKNADGTGGDAHQEYPTAWSAYAVGSQPTGSDATVSLPYEVACVCTFNTNKRGPRGRGRIYLPAFGTSKMGANGLFADAAVTSAGEAIGDLFDAVKGSTYAYVPLVVSMREKVLSEIQQITVGKVPDAQRRRRRSQDEAPITTWTTV